MSEESRRNIKEGSDSLRRGKEYLDDAASKFRKAGDGGTATKIEKMSQDAGKIREEVAQKTDPKKG